MDYKNILIVKLSAIGDVIHALPVAKALKTCYPQIKITWIVEPPAYDLLTNNPYIDEIIVFEKAKFKSLSGFVQHAPSFRRALRESCFDLVLDLQGLFKSAAISLFSGAPQRLVYCNARECSDLVGKKVCGINQTGHIVERYLDVARSIGCNITEPEFPIQITEQEASLAGAIAKQSGLAMDKPYIVLVPGTNWPSKCWPVNHFTQISDRLSESQLIPVFVGGNADKTLVEEVAAKSTVLPIDLTGKTTLKQLAYIIKNAQAVVAGDTGPMHLAAALGIPVIALFGPTDPKRNGPYGTGHVVLETGQPCRGCWKRQCPKSIDCLASIKPEPVFQAVMTALKK